MPYLNWKMRAVEKSVQPQPGMRGPEGHSRATLSLSLTPELVSELIPFLEEVYLRGGAELRLDLPDEWVVFWKTRDSESRLLLAHPQHGEWVATIALEADHGRRLLQKLAELAERTEPKDALSISELGAIGSVSNVEIILIPCNE